MSKVLVIGSGAREHALAVSSGIRVAGIEPSSPAAAAGVALGDLIVSFDGQPVTGVDDLHRMLDDEHIGRPSRLVVLRGGALRQLTVVPRGDSGPAR